jgi:hypothetical protein
MTQSVSCEKTKSKKSRPRKTFNRDHYHRCQMSMPAIEEIENRIQQWLNGTLEKFKPKQSLNSLYKQ